MSERMPPPTSLAGMMTRPSSHASNRAVLRRQGPEAAMQWWQQGPSQERSRTFSPFAFVFHLEDAFSTFTTGNCTQARTQGGLARPGPLVAERLWQQSGTAPQITPRRALKLVRGTPGLAWLPQLHRSEEM